VAYPNLDPILVETTNPLHGYQNYTQKFKNQYVNVLAESKLISNEDLNSHSVNELFEKHYFKEKTASLDNDWYSVS